MEWTKTNITSREIVLKNIIFGIDFLVCRYNGCYDDCKAYLGNKPKVQAPVLYYANSEFLNLSIRRPMNDNTR